MPYSKEIEQLDAAFIAGQFEKNGKSLPYRLYIPQGHEGEKLPLVLFMHGAGERGTDNIKQFINGDWLLRRLVEGQDVHPCYILAPQCPEEGDQRWVNEAFECGTYCYDQTVLSEPMRLAIDILDMVEEKYPIDRKREYVTGLSMGGYATWYLISRFPERFAAAVPVCGGGDPAQAEKIRSVPVWTFHGDQDDIVPISGTRALVDALRQVGGDIRYTEYPGVMHGSWVNAYSEPDLVDWLFSHRL